MWPLTHPKNATEQDQPIAAIHDRLTGGIPSRSSFSRPSAGRMPTKPAATCNKKLYSEI